DFVFGESLECAEVAVGTTAQRELEDGLGIRVELAHRRRVRVGRQVAADRTDLALHVDGAVFGGGISQVDDNRRHSLGRVRLDVVEVVDAGDGVLYLFGDQGVDGFRAGAGILG